MSHLTADGRPCRKKDGHTGYHQAEDVYRGILVRNRERRRALVKAGRCWVCGKESDYVTRCWSCELRHNGDPAQIRAEKEETYRQTLGQLAVATAEVERLQEELNV